MRCLALVVVIAGCSGGKSAAPATNPWRTAKLGSVYESRSITRMQKPFEHTTESTTKQTLLARTATAATVKLELSEGSSTSSQDVTIALREDAPAPHDGSSITKSEETCTVPAGTFHCTRISVELGETSSMVTWTTARVPVPLRSIVTNDSMTITSELVRVAER